MSDAGLTSMGDRYLSAVLATRQLLDLALVPAERYAFLDFVEQSARILPAEQKHAVADAIRELSEGISQALSEASSSGRGEVMTTVHTEDPLLAAVLERLALRAGLEVMGPKRERLLGRSMLMLLCSDFEVLVASAAKWILHAKPSLIKAEEASISLAELERLASVGAARDTIVERRVDSLMRDGFEDWAQWFLRVGVQWDEMVDDWATLVEVFLRRNVFVHANGLVSERYLGGLAAESDAPKLGEPLDLDANYLHAASERLLALGMLLIGGVWLQLGDGRNTGATDWLISRLGHVLESRLFISGSIISETMLKHSRGRLSRSQEQRLTIYFWVSQRGCGNLAAARPEIEAWDTSGLDALLAHAKPVLLERDDEALKAIRQLLADGRLTVVDLAHDPLYEVLMARRGDEFGEADDGEADDGEAGGS